MEIVAGLHQLKVPSPAGMAPGRSEFFTLPYLMEVRGGCAIIDPSWDDEVSIESLRKQMAELGASFKDIKQVIATHHHFDHYGMAGKIREESGAEVLIHAQDRDVLASDPWGGSQVEWFAMHGMPAAEAASERFPGGGGAQARFIRRQTLPDRTIEDGETLRFANVEFKALWTPGHTPGHLCFYDEAHELLLTGDHILPKITPNVGLRPGSEEDNPLGDYVASLEKLRGLKTRMVLPAHEFVFEDLDGRLDELESHHTERLQEMVDAVSGGATTAYEIARNVKWSIGHFDSFEPWSRRAAMSETLSHTRYLERRGTFRSWEEDGIVHHALT